MAIIRRNKHWLLAALIVLFPVAVWAADSLMAGEDNSANTMTGSIGYDRPSCWDGTYWDRLSCGANKEHGLADDDSITNCTALAASSTDYTLPTAGDYYEVRTTGNCASILCGATPTATSAANGHFIKVCDGVPFRGRLTGPVCAHIAPSAAGEICFVHLVP